MMTVFRNRRRLTALVIAFVRNNLSADAWLPLNRRISLASKWMPPVANFPKASQHDHAAARQQRRRRTTCERMSSRNVLDADFERVDETKSKGEPSKTSSAAEHGTEDSPQSLLDLSLEMDPNWKEARIPFVAPDGETYIDGKLAFTVDLDGVTYGIGVPFDHGAAIVMEKSDGSVVYLSPDDDENVELMEIMARQLQEHVDEDLKLQRTPRIMTISGNLSKYTEKWRDELVPKPVDVETLLDDSDETIDMFREFMRQELGEEEYAKTIQEAKAMSEDNDEIDMMQLFNIPGIGDSKDDLEGIEKLLTSMVSEGNDESQHESFPGGNDNLDHDGVALKLISYKFADGKAYSLVYLLKPFALIGKYVPDEKEIRFEFLTSNEEKIVIPKIEELCREDIQQAGLTLVSR